MENKKPDDRADALFRKADAAKQQGNLGAAIVALKKAIDIEPGRPAYRLHLALNLIEFAKKREPQQNEALAQAQTVVRMAPHIAAHWMVFGEIAMNCHRFPEACAGYEKFLDMEPQHAFAWGLLGFCYARDGRIDMAIDACTKAVELDSELGMPHFLLSTFYGDQRYWNPPAVAKHGEMAFTSKKAITVYNLESMWNAAHGFLHLGNYPKGFTYFEARLFPNQTNAGNMLPLQRYKAQKWEGQRNCRVLVQTEMGLGDALLMMRFIFPLRAKFDIEVIFECHESMLDIVRANLPGVECIPYGSGDSNKFDYQLPIMSLPVPLEITRESVPNAPYIVADPLAVEEWRGRLKLDLNWINIGICWFSGRQSYSADNHETSKRKSVPFELIKPIIEMPGFNFVSLQVDRDDVFPGPGIKNFSDTAAIIELMDIVITVDTAVANLAGAMGKQFWLMDRFDHCWRYCDIPTPWFPSARIYRQTAPRAWAGVVSAIMGDLEKVRDKIAE